MVWYSHLFQNFPQFTVIHTVKGFGIVNKADVFLELSCFFHDPADVGNLISGSSAFSKTSLYAEYIIRNAGLEEVQAGIKIAGRNINNLRYADDIPLYKMHVKVLSTTDFLTLSGCFSDIKRLSAKSE